MRIEITTGAAAWRALDDPGFLAAWRALAGDDPKLTLVQRPEFARAWYRAYREAHEPVLVTGRSEGGDELGLLPLARRLRDGALSHAGDGQAEYHGWIARREHDDAFPVAALRALARERLFARWSWRWCPPGTPLGWLADPLLRAGGVHAAVERRPSPVWDLRERAKLEKALDNRSLRAKANRFRRAGGLRFERIRDPERTRALLPVLARQCDFRQEVVNGVRPFADDPRKAAFFLARQDEPEASHFSVLWNGARPLAFHFGGCDGRTCLLGLSAYDPSEGKNSPGTLLLLELARALTEEGFERLDLTPGSDPYKLRYATGEQELARVTLHATRAGALRARATATLRRTLVRASSARDLEAQQRAARWQRDLRRAARELARGRAGGLVADLARRAFGRRRLVCLALERAPRASPDAGTEVRTQAWEDLLAAWERDPARRERLAAALDRFAAGETLYTVRGERGPALLGWRGRLAGDGLAEELVRAGLLAREAELLSGFERLAPDAGPAALRACLARMLADAAADEAPGIALCLARDDAAGREVAEELGFVARGHATQRRVLGRSTWSVTREDALAGGVPG